MPIYFWALYGRSRAMAENMRWYPYIVGSHESCVKSVG